MKRFLWALSGIISAVLITISSSASPVHATAQYVQWAPHAFSSKYKVKGNSTIKESRTVFNTDGANRAYFSIGAGETWSNLTFEASSLNWAEIEGGYLSLSFALWTQSAGSLGEWSNPILLTSPTGFEGDNKAVALQNVDSDIVPIRDDSGVGYAGYIVTLRATVYKGAGTNEFIRFGGPWLTNLNQSSPWGITMTQPTLTITPSYMTETSDNVARILGLLRTTGITATVDNSDVVSSINQGNQQAHQDAQASLAEQQKQTAEAEKQTQIQDEQKNFVTDTSTPEVSDIANSNTIPSAGLLPDGPLDSILLLPVNILNSIIQSFGGTCKPVIAPLPFVGDQDLVFPCFSDTFYTGKFAPLATAIGGVASAFILYGYFKHLYKKVDRAVSMETTDEDEWGIL